MIKLFEKVKSAATWWSGLLFEDAPSRFEFEDKPSYRAIVRTGLAAVVVSGFVALVVVSIVLGWQPMFDRSYLSVEKLGTSDSGNSGDCPDLPADMPTLEESGERWSCPCHTRGGPLLSFTIINFPAPQINESQLGTGPWGAFLDSVKTFENFAMPRTALLLNETQFFEAVTSNMQGYFHSLYVPFSVMSAAAEGKGNFGQLPVLVNMKLGKPSYVSGAQNVTVLDPTCNPGNCLPNATGCCNLSRTYFVYNTTMGLLSFMATYDSEKQPKGCDKTVYEKYKSWCNPDECTVIKPVGTYMSFIEFTGYMGGLWAVISILAVTLWHIVDRHVFRKYISGPNAGCVECVDQKDNFNCAV